MTTTPPAPVTAPATANAATTHPARRSHEHGWLLESRHATSTGWVLYVRCGGCGRRRVDHQDRADQVPRALSEVVRG